MCASADRNQVGEFHQTMQVFRIYVRKGNFPAALNTLFERPCRGHKIGGKKREGNGSDSLFLKNRIEKEIKPRPMR